MNPYEVILLIDPALGEEKIVLLITKIEDKIKALGGVVEKTEKWGIRRLASMIKKAKGLTQAYYVLINFKSASSVPAELRAYLIVTESVIRYFFSKAEVFAAAPSEEKEIAGRPLEATQVNEIKGEPLGEPQ